jgi:hypothetical protein
MESVSGDAQPGSAGVPLDEQLVVRVLDLDGIPVPDQAVNWVVKSGGGSVTPTKTFTDASGVTATTWTLGPSAGSQEAAANISGLPSVVFFATAFELGESCEGSPLNLAVGGSVVLLGPQASLACVSGGAAAVRDYVVVAFNAAKVSSANIGLSVVANGVVAIAGPPSPSPDLLQAQRTAREQASTAGIFEGRLRTLERDELAPRVRRGGVVLPPTATPSFSLSTPVLGETLFLNAQANSACSNAIDRPGRVVAVSQRAVVVADVDNPAGGFSDAEYQSIAATFDTLVYPLNIENFGTHGDIDGNSRVVLFYTREVNKITPPGSPNGFVAGFFFARDLFPRQNTTNLNGCPSSNESEIMYLMVPDPLGTINNNQRPKALVMRRTISTLAHEMQHLVNSSRRLYANFGAAYPERGWVEEGLSHLAEELLFLRTSGLSTGQNINAAVLVSSPQIEVAFNDHQADNAARVQDFLANTNTNWRFKTGSPELSTRGAATWFFRYIADRRGGTQSDTWRALSGSSDTGMKNIESVIQADPHNWLRDWSVSLYVDDAVAGLPPRYMVPTWDLRSVVGLLGSGSTYALRPPALASGVARTASLQPGGALYYRFGVAAGGEGRLEVNASTNISQLSVVVLRTR